MRAVVTRVVSASVDVGETTIARIGTGLLVLLGVARDDVDADAPSLARKIATLRIFADDEGAMNRSLLDIGGAALVVSQFTLLADARGGRRPSYANAAPGERGRVLYDSFVATLGGLGPAVETGRFGADMLVTSVNDGPVTILLDTEKRF